MALTVPSLKKCSARCIQSSKQPDLTQQSRMSHSAFCSESFPSDNALGSDEDEKDAPVVVSKGATIGPNARFGPPSELLIQKRDKKSVRDNLVLEKSEVKSAAPGAIKKIVLKFHGTREVVLKFRGTSIKPEDVGADMRYESSVDATVDTGDKASVPIILGEPEGSEPKFGWKLRPRNGMRKVWQENADAPEEQKKSKSREKKDEKQEISIPLLEEEIEADLVAMTGSKPYKRHRKRAKKVQNKLDNLFPGSQLGFINPNSYKVPK